MTSENIMALVRYRLEQADESLQAASSVGTPLFSCLGFENSRVQLEMILGESQTACYA
jgi:hypothetical protein